MTARARVGDVRLIVRQLYYEQLGFWRNPFGAGFTVCFSVVFLVLLAASGGTSRSSAIYGLPQIQYYVPGFAAYGVMSACFNLLAISLVNRRETGLLKRLRLSPLPSWVMVAALFLNALAVSVVQVIVLFLVGRFAFNAHLPGNLLPIVVVVVIGAVCFTAIGIAMSTVVPNADAAGPMVSIIFFVLLFLSGMWYPLSPGSTLARISNWFPVHHLILAMAAPFEFQAKGAHVSPWDWGDLRVLVIWGIVAGFVAVRRFRWEPGHK